MGRPASQGSFSSCFQKGKGRSECPCSSYFSSALNAKSSSYQSDIFGDGMFCHPSIPSIEISPRSLIVQKLSGCWGPAPAGSRGTLRMNGVSKGKRERERETRLGVCSRVWQCFVFYHSFYTLSYYIYEGKIV